MLEPVDEAAELEDAAEDEGDEVLFPLPQPVLTAPTTRVATAQPATVTRASSMALPPTPRRLTLLRNAVGNKTALMNMPAAGRRLAAYAGAGRGQGSIGVRSTR